MEPIKDKNILITGGCGFVGGQLARYFAKDNYVTVVDDLRYKKFIPERFHHLMIPENCRLIDGPMCRAPLHDIDIVIHAATVNIIDSMTNPKGCMDVNWWQSVELFDRIGYDTQIVYLSTSSVYGNATVYPTPEVDRVNCTNYYSISKHLAEMYLLQRRKDACVVRLSNVYGEGQMPHNPYAGVMSKLFRAKIRKELFVLYGDGQTTRDYTYVGDVISGVEAAIIKGVRGVYNIGTGIETTTSDLTWMMGVEVVVSEPRSIDNILRRSIDAKKLMMDTGWSVKVDLKEGLRRQEEWLMENGIFDK